jgi:Zn-dependent M28 family amino/carboxypeptidase
LTAEEFIVSSRIKSEEKVVFLIENWSTFLDLIGHEFSKEELRLCDDLEMKQRIYINSEKTKPSDDWRASIVKKSSKVFTENIFVPLIWSEKNKETVLLTAHYDHLGLDSTGIYFGADDNASGVSLLLLFGDWLQQKKITETQTKNVVLVFFSGEEQGLLGSRHFVKSERLPLSTITACVNFDMVGFVNQEKPRAFIVAYNDTDTNTIFVSKNTSIELVNERHFLHEFSSDQQSFADEKILSFLVFTGLHDFYHTTQDTPEKINYSAMNDLFLFLTKWMQDRLFID